MARWRCATTSWAARRLTMAASLIGADAEQLKVNPMLNIQGAAALLDYLAEQKSRWTGSRAWTPGGP